MNKVDLFRLLNARQPVVAERLIARWGTVDLGDLIDVLIREAPRSGLGVTGELIQVLRDLQTLHLQEFPHLANLDPVVVYERLSKQPDFQVVHAAFPHVAQRLVETWGRRAFHDYVSELFSDKRGGRQGFPMEVVMGIFRLTQLHDQEYPGVKPISGDVWASQDDHGMRLR